jgi:hypothetical protein
MDGWMSRVLNLGAATAGRDWKVSARASIPASSALTRAGRIMGQVLAIEGDTYIIRQSDGHEVTLHSTQKTEMPVVIGMGDRVETQMDDSGAVILINPAKRCAVCLVDLVDLVDLVCFVSFVVGQILSQYQRNQTN